MNNYRFTPLQIPLAVLAFVVFVTVLLFITEEVGGYQPMSTPRPTVVFTPTMHIHLPIVERSPKAGATATPRPTAMGR